MYLLGFISCTEHGGIMRWCSRVLL